MAGHSGFGTRLLMRDMIDRPIEHIHTVNDEIRIAGDHTAVFTDGTPFRVTGSTGNDGYYTCDGDSTIDGAQTVIATVEVLSDATADGVVEYWADIANVSNIGGPGLSLDTVDITAHDSPDAWEEHVATILRSGETTLDLYYDPDEVSHDANEGLPAAQESRALVDFEVIFPVPTPGGTTWVFSAVVNSFEPTAAHDGAMVGSAGLKISGIPQIP